MAAKFEVIKSVDAYVKYSAIIEAESAQEAIDEAQRNEGQYQWKREYETEFDATEFFEDEVTEISDEDAPEDPTEPPVINLYYLDAETDDGDYNASAFIRAESPEAAYEFWKRAELSEMALETFSDVLVTVDPKQASEDDLRIFLVTQTDQVGVLGWHLSAGVPLVAYAKRT